MIHSTFPCIVGLGKCDTLQSVLRRKLDIANRTTSCAACAAMQGSACKISKEGRFVLGSSRVAVDQLRMQPRNFRRRASSCSCI